MATLKMIDAGRPITLMAHKRGRITDHGMVALATKLELPQLLNVSQGIDDAERLEIREAESFIAWLQAKQWASRLEQDLQCISEDGEGRPLLTTWISAGEFERLVADAQGTAFYATLQRALEMWRQLGADEIVFEGYKAVAAESAA